MQSLLDYASFAPHGFCLLWNPWLISLHVVADLLIALSYFAIPGALVLFLRRRPELRFRGLVVLFAAFITLCGLTHLVSLATLWLPVYQAEGVLKLLTGMVSATTAIVLFRLVPTLVAIPSPSDLEDANARLRAEIAAHEATLSDLREAQRTLESKVEARTRELTVATQRLSVLSREAVHRSRNLLTVVTSIARQTVRNSSSFEVFLDSFLGRITALANATGALIEGSGAASVSMARLIARQLEPTILTFGDRLTIDGTQTDASPQAAQQISLVVHELATNSQKHGALSGPNGAVRVGWSVDDGGPSKAFVLTWDEDSAAAEKNETATPTDPPGQISGGFGSALLLKIAPATLGGRAEISNSEGFHYRLTVPLDAILPHVEGDTQTEELARKIVDDAWDLGGTSPA